MARPTPSTFYDCLVSNDFRQSMQQAHYLIQKGEYDNFWMTCICVAVEHIHILMPKLPAFLWQHYSHFTESVSKRKKHMKAPNMQRCILVVKVIATAHKQHISIYVNAPFYNAPCDARMSARACIIAFHDLLGDIGKVRRSDKKITNRHISRVYALLGQMMSIDCDSHTNLDVMGINLYTHTHSAIHEKMMKAMFSVILSHAKPLGRRPHLGVASLVKFYHTKLLHRIEKHSYLAINIMFYFVFIYDFSFPPIQEQLTENDLKIVYPHTKVEPVKTLIPRTNINDLGDEILSDPFLLGRVYKLANKKLPPKSKKLVRAQNEFEKKLKLLTRKSMFDSLSWGPIPTQNHLKKEEEENDDYKIIPNAKGKDSKYTNIVRE